MTRCECYLKSNLQCRYTAKPNSKYCGIHKNCKRKIGFTPGFTVGKIEFTLFSRFAKNDLKNSPTKKLPTKKSPKYIMSSEATNGIVWMPLVINAIKALNKPNGSTRQAISKFIIASNPSMNPDIVSKRVHMTVKRGESSGKLLRCGNSYRINQ